MSHFSKITAILALATTAALGSTGCVAEGEDPTEEGTEASAEEALSPEAEATESSSEALSANGWGDGCGRGDYCFFDSGRVRHYARLDRIVDRYDWWEDSYGRYWNDDCRGRSIGYYCNRADFDRYYGYRDRFRPGLGLGLGRGRW
ncbi:hypothetical protein [Polyangium aurulentum]|uniref:hypothetical protein n=1 Tax=Polyangium aurulentum TaxID=2567896 RepID=UPI0010AE7593|nr:hypothetical protein [Polyangium aurulentum]UQA55272.1 hypothetical protein E8A73_028460 [Polyangium aurulentum]